MIDEDPFGRNVVPPGRENRGRDVVVVGPSAGGIEALYPGMPTSAIEAVSPDRVLRATELGPAIAKFAAEPFVTVAVAENPGPAEDQLLEDIFSRVDRGASDDPQSGDPSGYSCPACGGSLWQREQAGEVSHCCRTGHA
jgi:two-component system, chemotaxis family, protein-glutamate methylesterase/glutaminase